MYIAHGTPESKGGFLGGILKYFKAPLRFPVSEYAGAIIEPVAVATLALAVRP
jgi:hypothetical protein